ncbi:hypothetical protein VNI00_017041 [Paramarasmius palmivorus]|uniref:Uncharacterized protein n=1 Tax=Paramarasmius palmivorus TaxID=297713 RepID=A0AAW0B727_9AGAR
MEYSYWSWVHQAFGMRCRSGQRSHDHLALCSLILHWHDAIVNHGFHFFTATSNTGHLLQHLPDITTVDGLLQVFATIVLLEIAPVLDIDRYHGGVAWKEVDRLYGRHRSYCKELLLALDRLLVVREKGGQERLSVTALWESFFVQQCVTLVVIARAVESPRVPAAQMEHNLFQDLRRRNPLLARSVDSVLYGGSHLLGSVGEYSLVYNDCCSMKWKHRQQINNNFTITLASWGQGQN